MLIENLQKCLAENFAVNAIAPFFIGLAASQAAGEGTAVIALSAYTLNKLVNYIGQRPAWNQNKVSADAARIGSFTGGIAYSYSGSFWSTISTTCLTYVTTGDLMTMLSTRPQTR